MGKLKSFEIQLENEAAVYHPGGTVTGSCIIETKGELRLRSLKIYMRGVAKVHWTEPRSTGTRLGAYTEHFNAESEYFYLRRNLGNADANFEVLDQGVHSFPFSFQLPINGITTSFEGKHGNIRYWLKAEIDKPWALNHRTKKAFTVIAPIDINRIEYQAPVESGTERSLCCWLCVSGPISINARTDRRGYCPGESVAISADFENNSNRTVLPSASLHQVQTYFADGKSKVRSTKFTVLSGLPISPGSRTTWDGQLLKIPAVSPSIINCNLIKVDYYVKVQLHVAGSNNLSMHLPIVVGTIPFRRASIHYLSSLRSSDQIVDYYGQTLVMPCPPPYRAVPTPPPPVDDPPTYADSIEGAVDIRDEDEDTMGEVSFTPRYIYVYDYRSPPPYSAVDPQTSAVAQV